MIITITNIGEELLRLSAPNKGNFVAISDWTKRALLPLESAELIATLPNTGYTENYMDFMQSLSAIDTRISTRFTYYEKVVPGQIQSLPLEELSGSTAYDISPVDNPGTYQDVILNAAENPVGGGMPEFLGDSYVDLYSAGFANDFDGLHGSLAFFIQAKTLDIWNDPDLKYLFALFVDADNFIEIYKISSPTNTITFDFYSNGIEEQFFYQITPTLNPIHICLTWSNPSNRIIAYVNGVVAASDFTDVGDWVGVPSLAKLGNANSGGVFGWEGYISQYRLYDRELSAAEVQILSNQ